MKSQDIGLLLYLHCLHQQLNDNHDPRDSPWPGDWKGWSDQPNNSMIGGVIDKEQHLSRFTARALEQQTGISKSQISLALKRCYAVNLASKDPETEIPLVNKKALYEFIVHGLRYVFPAQPGALTRGISTSFGAPVLQGKLLSAGDTLLVWPDAWGNAMGQSISPLFATATLAARNHPQMYALLALTDAVRIGRPRESKLAAELLRKELAL
ncbi:hypothetical protein C2846_18115 [Pseudomonas jilinensis]|uniref:Uncharacterized protein n=2 Tax=Pseudomonas jilinensis TaxID=2078689 RepID=A0A396RSP2_9PSED|nr:hypothetical protein C2846_18115 [Pseudomonas jilinensis]